MIALAIMLAAAFFQRITGPTYPERGTAQIGGETIRYTLTRTHSGEGDQRVAVPYPGPPVQGRIEWRRHAIDFEWRIEAMAPEAPSAVGEERGGAGERPRLVGYLPHQPPAGKLDYRVILESGQERVALPAEGYVVTRFKGNVPLYILLPHIMLMFLGLLFSTRAGLEALSPRGEARGLARWSFGLLLAGGMVLGPVALYYAFGTFWEGVPLGWDITDNKTLIFVATWAWALFAGRGGRNARRAVLIASLITLAVYLIPHSVLGSEFDYIAR